MEHINLLVTLDEAYLTPLRAMLQSLFVNNPEEHVPVSPSVSPSHNIGQTLAFLVIAWTSILHIFTVRSWKSLFSVPLSVSRQLSACAFGLLLVFAALAAIPPPASLFILGALNPRHWLIAIGLSLISIIVAEYVKM